MSAQAALEGRFLGGRPPYGYRIADAGPHPNPAKAADGKRLHKLEPDPDTAGLVGRIFAEYLAGRGLFAIAEGLTRDRIPSPSQQDRARNRHRTGEGWSKSAVRTILCNPRYTGRQVWNKQRKDGILLDVNDVAAGYETRMRWNQAGSWVWSDAIVHEPLIPAADFDAAQAIMADAGRARRTSREAHQRASHPYVLRGRLYCGYCGRRMQGQYSNHAPYYRCRYPATTPWPATSATPATFTSAKPTCCPPSTPGWWSSSPRTGSSRHPRDARGPGPGPAHHPARQARRRHSGPHR